MQDVYVFLSTLFDPTELDFTNLRISRENRPEEWKIRRDGRDADWRGLYFLVDDVSIPGNSPLRSQAFLRAEVISESSRHTRPGYFLHFLFFARPMWIT